VTPRVRPPNGQPRGARRAAAFALLGVAAATGAVLWVGAPQVWRALAAVGLPGFLLLCLFTLAVEAMLGAAWAVLYPGGLRRSALFVGARLLRDGVVQVLPFTPLAGPVAGARVLALGGVAPAGAAAAALLDTALEYLSGLAFMAAGAVLAALRLSGGERLFPSWAPFAVALALAAAAAGLLLTPGPGLKLLARLVVRLRPEASGEVEELRETVETMLGRPGPVAACFLLHLAGWVIGAGWTALALTLAGRPIGYPAALMLEAMICAVRGVAFVVPNAFGVQEGAYALLAPLFGLPPDVGVALSLLKRGRDLALGAPMVLIWQLREAARLRAARR
jgi:putative membrane protein